MHILHTKKLNSYLWKDVISRGGGGGCIKSFLGHKQIFKYQEILLENLKGLSPTGPYCSCNCYKLHTNTSRVIQPEIEFICSLSTTILPWLKSSLLWGTVPSGPWFLISPVINQPSTLLDCSGECYREFQASFVQKPRTFLHAPLLCNT